jgi:hypothetical protein
MKTCIYRLIKKSLCTWWSQYKKTRKNIRTIRTPLIIWRWPSQNIFGMWTVLYWTRSSRTQFGVSINVWRLARNTLNIPCKFLYCNHQVYRDVLITLCLHKVQKIVVLPSWASGSRRGILSHKSCNLHQHRCENLVSELQILTFMRSVVTPYSGSSSPIRC